MSAPGDHRLTAPNHSVARAFLEQTVPNVRNAALAARAYNPTTTVASCNARGLHSNLAQPHQSFFQGHRFTHAAHDSLYETDPSRVDDLSPHESMPPPANPYGPAPPPVYPPGQQPLPPPARPAAANTVRTVTAEQSAKFKKTSYQKKLAEFAASNPDGMRSLMDDVAAKASVTNFLLSPHTEAKNQLMLSAYEGWMIHRHPTLPVEEHWRSDVVLREIRGALRMRVMTTNGRYTEHVSATTLLNWLTTTFYLIMAYTVDNFGRPDGLRILSQCDLYNQLTNDAKLMITELQLCRHPREKLYYGSAEILLAIRSELAASEWTTGHERLVKIQGITVMILIFYTCLRPGSCAPSCKQFAEESKYMTLGDITIMKLGKFTFQVLISAEHWKGFNIGLGHRSKFTLLPAQQAANTILDAGLWFVVFLLCRGAFEQQTVQEIVNFKGAQLTIRPEMRKDPLFLRCAPGGHDLMAGQPTTSSLLSQHTAASFARAGLPPVGAYGIRRDTAESLATRLGTEAAQLTLNHTAARNTFTRFYSLGTETMDLVGARLGEDSEITKRQMTQAQMRVFSSNVVTAMLTLPNKPVGTVAHSDRTPHRKALTAEDKLAKQEVINSSDAGSAALEKKKAAWKALRVCYDRPVRSKKDVAEGLKGANALRKDPLCGNVTQEDADACQAAYKAALLEFQTLARALTRTEKTKTAKASLEARHDPNHPENTTENRKAQMATLETLNADTVRGLVAPGSSSGTPSSLVAPGSSSDVLPAGPANRPSDCVAVTDAHAAREASEAKALHAARTQFKMACGSGPLSDEDHTIWLESLAGSYELYNEGDWEDEIKYAQDPQVERFTTVLAKQLGQATPAYDARELIATTRAHLQIHQDRQNARTTADPESLTDWTWLADDDTVEESEDVAPVEVYEYSLEDLTTPPGPDPLCLEPDFLRQMLAHVIVEPETRNTEAEKQYELDGQRWLCQKCKQFLFMKPREFPNLSKVREHWDNHNEWNDLVGDMMLPCGKIWKCPTAGCNFHATSEDRVRDHCVSSCVDRVRYLALREVHRDRRSNWAARNLPKPQATSKREDTYPALRAAVLEGFEELPFVDTDDFARAVGELGLDYTHDEIATMSGTLTELQEFCNNHRASRVVSQTPVVNLDDHDITSMGYPSVKNGQRKAGGTGKARADAVNLDDEAEADGWTTPDEEDIAPGFADDDFVLMNE